MILIDDRAGSADLYPLLRAKGLPAQLTRMDYGDVSWLGMGEGGVPVSVGVEVKTILDVAQCVCTGRFAGHQLPGLVSSYDDIWLLVEGLWRANARTGILERRNKRGIWVELTVGARRFMFTDLLTWLFTMQIKGGIKVHRSSDWGEAVLWISSLYSWWTKGWSGHKSHLAFNDGTSHGSPFQRGKLTGNGNRSHFDRALLNRPSLLRMVAAQLPNIGYTRSADIAKKFGTVEGLVSASIRDIASVEGVGEITARKVYNAIHGVVK